MKKPNWKKARVLSRCFQSMKKWMCGCMDVWMTLADFGRL